MLGVYAFALIRGIRTEEDIRKLKGEEYLQQVLIKKKEIEEELGLI